MRKVILDTNAYSALAQGDKEVLNALSAADLVYLSVVVIAELLYGFKGGTREGENRAMLERFCQKPTVKILFTTWETAETFAFVKDSLRARGTSLPLNDIWIAAQVIESGSVLITFDNHFTAIPGLRLWGGPRS